MATAIVRPVFPPELADGKLVTEDVKSKESADEHRLNGNKLYVACNFHEALFAYNRSLCCSFPGSLEMGLVYSNRSALYFEAKMYGKCLENIALARQNILTEKQLPRLERREADCRAAIAENGDRDVRLDFFKLSRPLHPMYPKVVDCLRIVENQKFTRHVITTEDLKTGEIICIEEPFMVCPDTESRLVRCCYCLSANNFSLLPCPNCPSVMYCSEECRNKDTSHPYQCCNEALPELFNLTMRMQFMAFNIAGGFKEVIELLHPSKMTPKTVLDFDLTNPDDPAYKKNMLVCLNSLSKQVHKAEKKKLMDIYSHLVLDTPPINDMPRSEEEIEFLMEFIPGQAMIYDTNAYELKEYTKREDLAVGGAIFPFSSLFNHSCMPNAKRFTVNNKITIFAARPIKAGEQIFVSYGFSSFRMSKAERVFHMSKYGFRCNCVACVEDYPRLEKMERKDPSQPKPAVEDTFTFQEAIEQFKRNCEYIEENIAMQPCYEVSALIEFNVHLLDRLARDPIYDAEDESLIEKGRRKAMSRKS